MNLPAKILQEKLRFPVNTKIDAQLPQKLILFQNKSKISCSCVGASKILLQQTQCRDLSPKLALHPTRVFCFLAEPGEARETSKGNIEFQPPAKV